MEVEEEDERPTKSQLRVAPQSSSSVIAHCFSAHKSIKYI